MSDLQLCENCLGPDAKPFPIGPEHGSQRDPWTDTLSLCEYCKNCLERHALGAFAERFQSERLIVRDKK